MSRRFRRMQSHAPAERRQVSVREDALVRYRRNGLNMTARTSPGSRSNLARGLSRGNSKPRWRGFPAEAGSGSTRRAEPTPGFTLTVR